MKQRDRQPFLGSNAKAFAIQLVLVLFCVIVAVPFANGWLDTYMKPWFEAGLDELCSSTGLCTPEAAERLSASERQ